MTMELTSRVHIHLSMRNKVFISDWKFSEVCWFKQKNLLLCCEGNLIQKTVLFILELGENIASVKISTNAQKYTEVAHSQRCQTETNDAYYELGHN